MTHTLKKILIATTMVVFTACGGGGETSSGDNGSSGSLGVGSSGGAGSAKKLKKMTRINADKTQFSVTEYTYNTNNLVEKSVEIEYIGDSEQGDMKSKQVSEYTYEKTYNMVKVVSKYYDEDNKLTYTSTSLQTYDGNKCIKSKGENTSTTPALNMSSEGNLTDYVGPIATKTTSDIWDKDGKLFSQSHTNIEVLENKATSMTTTTKSTILNTTTTSSILRTFDSHDRVIKTITQFISVKDTLTTTINHLYDNDKSKREPIFTCFGGYVQMAKNHRSKYPKSENTCYLSAGQKMSTKIAEKSSYESNTKYVNTIENGLVTKREDIEDDVLRRTYTYEYE